MGVLAILKQYADTTSGHGVSLINTAPCLRVRIFWSCVFAFCLGCFLYQVTILILKLQQNEKLTTVELRFESVPFPAVTMCNLNPFKQSRAKRVPQINSLMTAYDVAFGKLVDDVTRKRRSIDVNDLHLWRCSFDESNRYYRPFEQGDPSEGSDVCICVNDNWDYLSYCSPVHNWVKTGCFKDLCNPDLYCGPYGNTTEIGAPGSVICLCNTIMDGCYNSSTMTEHEDASDHLALGVSVDHARIESLMKFIKTHVTVAPQSTEHSPDSTADAVSTTTDVSRSTSEDSKVSSTTKPYPTYGASVANASGDYEDYSFVFEGVHDEFALQSKAKESLVYISQQLNVPTRISISQSKPDFVRTCSFGGDSCDIERDFVLKLDPIYGNCYTFNHEAVTRRKSSSRGGPNYGLRLLLFTDRMDYMFTSDSMGIRLEIHDQAYHPFPDVLGKSAPTGMIASFVVRLKIIHLRAPYGNCRYGSNDNSYYFSGNYTVEGCYRSCSQKALTEACGCGDARFPPAPGAKLCRGSDLFSRRCIERYAGRLATGTCDCPLPCQQVQFTTAFSASRWPSPSLKLANLVADLGGNIGLWLGASVITCVEFALLVCQLVGYIVTDCFKNSAVSPDERDIRPLAVK